MIDGGDYIRPTVFLLYTADLLDLITKHGLHPHLFADDTQVYGSCVRTDVDALQSQLSTCVSDISKWMNANRLQLKAVNGSRPTSWCSSQRKVDQLPTKPVDVGGSSVVCRTGPRCMGRQWSHHVHSHHQGRCGLFRDTASVIRSVHRSLLQ